MYSIEHAVNIWTFVQAIGIGYLIGIILELFRLLRHCFLKGKYAVFIQDILFFVISAAVTFVFILRSSFGVVRGYILIGEAVGFAVYLLTLGKILFRIGEIYSSVAGMCADKCAVLVKQYIDKFHKKTETKKAARENKNNKRKPEKKIKRSKIHKFKDKITT